MRNDSRLTGLVRAIHALFIAAFIILATPLASDAQQPDRPAPAPTPARPAAKPPAPIELGPFTFSGSLRVRVENWNWFETPGFDDNYVFGAAVLRLSLGQQKERIEWLVEGEFPSLIGLPEHAIAPAPLGQLGQGGSYFAGSGTQDASAVLKQALVRFKGLGSDKPSSLRIGRFEFSDGAETAPADATLATLKRDHIAQRLIGPFGFTHIGRSFDGVAYARNTNTSNFTLFAARPTEGVFQLRSLYELDIDLYYAAFTKPLPGKNIKGEARAFVLHYHDGRRTLKTDNRPQPVRAADRDNIRLTTMGGNYIGAIKAGRGTVDLLFWGAGQFGQWGTLDHRAGAIAAEGGYQPNNKLKCWIRGGYFRSSGDGDPSDGDHTTFFSVLPTPRIYARYPFYNQMNNEDSFVELRFKPHQRLSMRGDIHYLRLASERDLWYVGGGAFQKDTFGYVGRPSLSKKSLATVFDLSTDWNIASRTTLTFYVAGVRGGDIPGRIYPQAGSSPLSHFLYFEFVQRF
jgi:hypothetical protein